MKKQYQKRADTVLDKLDNLSNDIEALAAKLADLSNELGSLQDDMQADYDEKSEKWQEGDAGVEAAEEIGNVMEAASALGVMATELGQNLASAMEYLGGTFDPTLTMDERATKLPHVWRKYMEGLQAQVKTFAGVAPEEATVRVRSGYGDEGTYLKAQLVDLLDHEITVMIRPDGEMQLYTANGGIIGRNESSNTMVVTSCDFQSLQRVFRPKRKKG